MHSVRFEKNGVYYESHMNEVKQILADGEKRARAVAGQTMQQVHDAMELG